MVHRALRVAAVPFRPAEALIGRMRYAVKFVAVGLVLLIPLGFVVNSFVELRQSQISATARERQGLRYMRALLTLTADVVQARRSSVASNGQLAPNLHRDIAAVDAADRALVPPVPAVRTQWQATRMLIASADIAEVRSRTAQFTAYDEAASALINLIVRLGDRTDLTLDPDMDSYYLAHALQYWLPSLCNVTGRIADRLDLAVTEPFGDDFDVFVTLAVDHGVLNNTRTQLTKAVSALATSTHDATVRRMVLDRSTQLTELAATMDLQLATAISRRSLAAYSPRSADMVRLATTIMVDTLAAALDRLLRSRIARYQVESRRIQLWGAGAVVLSVYLFVGFYRSVSDPVRRIVETLRAVAAGDLTRRVTVRTHDELGYVAEALNETIERTQVATESLAAQATRDALTGLPNRSVVIDRLEHAITRAGATGRMVAAIFVDLDQFKLINDSLGHEAGDDVLRAVAHRLAQSTRATDTVARLAGDEFVVISEDLRGADEAVAAAERVVDATSRPITIRLDEGERDVAVGASAGIAFADGTDAAVTASGLLRDADVAMYRAKQRGRGRVEVFDDSLRSAIEQRLETHQDLRRALEAGELLVYYQPIVETDTGRLMGFEALVRWQHPSRGLLAPGDFIESAEESGLIIPLGAQVLTEACRQAARWRGSHLACGDLHVSVNVSAAQFGHPGFVAAVADALADSGLDPAGLWLEITETSVLADVTAARETLAALRALGVNLAIDDFGTGYSSLAYLRLFPIQVLKIDRSFIMGIGRAREDVAIVEMVVGLGRTLGLTIVAEGVETEEQLATLRRLGCDACQGYHFGRPSPPAAAWDSVERRLRAGHPI